MTASRTTATAPTGRFTSERVRRDFLEFFAARGHVIVPSGPVFPQDDPTLLFTNAGMNQFKDVFLGTGTRPYSRAVDTQKCIRVSGKHNDLEEVGVDTYHHTFFEMLGNWSFGDYFKREAIGWSWELLTSVWQIPRDRLWVTVFAGDEKDRLPADDDAAEIWASVGVDRSRILRFGRKDNFWEMGETGPCGPCTEIHVDRGGPGSDPRDGADRAIGVNAGNERFMEIWNNVFIQYNRLDDGSLRELPAKHVDTGMGFERILGVLQGKRSNYDTDLFTPIFERLGAVSGRRYEGGASRADVAFRVCADHVRAVTAAVSDGAIPANTGRGYVLRRLVRRAARFGRQELGLEEPFLHQLVPTVAEVLGGTFPEMREREAHVRAVVEEEERAFGRTLGRGLARFAELEAKLARTNTRSIPGEAAFELYATYGFPRDLVELMARERGLGVDEAGWDQAERAHQDASRSEGKFRQALSAEALAQVRPTRSTFHEPGAPALSCETEVLYAGATGKDGEVALVLAESPFYPEGGGQVGDRGTIEAVDGGFALEVRDAQRMGSVVVHTGALARGALAEPARAAGRRVRATVDDALRARTRKNHTATHLLHKALKEVLGTHVAQQGSYVGPDRLRFDFSHGKAIPPEDLERIERRVNEKIVENAAVRTTVEELDAAKARGVVAMFGEKYDAKVRVLDVGGWSLELCGGTHVSAAGDIGPFVILSERAVAAGVRRIEAVTGPAAVEEFQRQRRLLRTAAQAVKAAPDELPARIEQLQAQLKEAKKKGAVAAGGGTAAAFEEVKAGLRRTEAGSYGAFRLAGLDLEGVRDLAARVQGAEPKLAVALFGEADGRVPFVILCQGLAKSAGLHAGELAKAASAHLGGGGGGRPESAQGQGQDPAGLEAALAEVRARFERAFS